MHKFLTLFLLSILSSTINAGGVQTTDNEWRSLQASDEPVHRASLLLRDPFSDPQIAFNGQGSAFNQGSSGGFGVGFQRGRGDFKVPELIFKGYIESKEDKAPMALIQIGNNKVHMVREGDEINVDPSQPRNAIRITKINRLSITVETGILGTMRVLR
jgi:hypothetical protein